MTAATSSHADQGPESGALVRKKLGLDSAQRSSHHQQRRQHAARSARAQRNRRGAQRTTGRRDQRRAPVLVIEEVGEDSDQAEQQPRDSGRDEADSDGEQRDGDDGAVGCEIAQVLRRRMLMRPAPSLSFVAIAAL